MVENEEKQKSEKPTEEKNAASTDGKERRSGITRRLNEDSWRMSLDRREDWELRNGIGKILSDEERDRLRQRIGKARLLPIDRRIGPRDIHGGRRKQD